MITLDLMNENDFKTFNKTGEEDYIQSKIKEGCWLPEEAGEKMKKLANSTLPNGLATPNSHFFNINNDENCKVGGLWYNIVEKNGVQSIFIFFIHILEESRRCGFGAQALRMIENQAREKGITTIALNVFKHNHQAIALYKKLGYTGEYNNMTKEIK